MLNVNERGEGSPVVLIHGFPMHSAVWDEVVSLLSKQYHVITLDLPGFGKSDPLPDGFTIEDVARVVHQELTSRIKGKATIVGHSLGGYVALALARNYPGLFQGLVLLHSTAYADTEEKRATRTKVVEFIQANGVEAFTSGFIQPLFADKSHASIDRIRSINLASKTQSVIGYTIAMRDREDSGDVIRQATFSVLLLPGDRDPGIPLSTMHEQQSLSPLVEMKVLQGQAHMALVEDPGIVAKEITEFVNRIS